MLEQSLSQDTLNDSDGFEGRQSNAPTPHDGASTTLLVRYQTLLVQIFETPDLAGITAQELENFKRDFQQSRPKAPVPASMLGESQTKPDIAVENGSPSSYDRNDAPKELVRSDPSDDLSDLGYVASSTPRRRSHNTTPSSVPPPASLPPIDVKKTEYLDLNYDSFRNLTLEDIVNQNDVSLGPPKSKDLDSAMDHLLRLQVRLEDVTTSATAE
ncbi:hypothetical protein INS49_003116 [Diaporthe citri]|uniref:uncharacterized protein n=1 Tax=Diaporthe citri TaxID=83186 RepID=UPI001C80E407|nr:uncharacterized protein INS49_003116 [Diaporthe citri]KAG6368898.1 hypothetical protein INS49_003116 [Diaporthe citri]